MSRLYLGTVGRCQPPPLFSHSYNVTPVKSGTGSVNTGMLPPAMYTLAAHKGDFVMIGARLNAHRKCSLLPRF